MFITFLFQIVWEQGFSVSWGISLKWYSIATALLLQGCYFHHSRTKTRRIGVFLQPFLYIIYRLLRKCQGATSQSLQNFCSQSYHFFCLTDQEASLSLVRNSRWDRGIKVWLTMNMSGWRNTTQHVPCCFPVSVTYLPWHHHHYPGLVLTQQGAVS